MSDCTGGGVEQAAPGPIKVLVIDDSNTIRRSAEMFLRQAGFEVILAEDGFDALAKITRPPAAASSSSTS